MIPATSGTWSRGRRRRLLCEQKEAPPTADLNSTPFVRQYDILLTSGVLFYAKTPNYKTIIPAMMNYYETQSYVFTHGWIPCVRSKSGYSYYSDWRESSETAWQLARWYNGMDAAQTADEEKTILCGHWHCSYGHAKYEHKGSEFGPDADFAPYFGPHVIALDACTAYSKKVNILVLEDNTI